MMLDGFIALLIADTDTNALVSGRVYASVAPRGYVLPAIVIHRYGGLQEYQFDGPAGLREDQIQVDCYANDSSTAQQLAEAARELLISFVGALSDGTVVRGCYLERDMDMPFLPNADAKGITNRSLLGFRVVSVR